MAPFAWLLNGLASLVVLVFVGRACIKLLQNPDETHGELVPTWERRATTMAGIPLMLLGASTLTNGPLAVPYNPLSLLLPGIVLFVYPDFTPTAAG